MMPKMCASLFKAKFNIYFHYAVSCFLRILDLMCTYLCFVTSLRILNVEVS